jgi:rhamnosyltransferase
VSGARPRAAGVVVAYEPDAEALACIARLARELDPLFLVDNSVHLPLQPPYPAGARRIDMHGNAGIAAALNSGIAAAADAGCDSVFLFDQDTEVVPGFAQRMLAARASLAAAAVILIPDRTDRAVGARARHPVLQRRRVRYRTCDADQFMDVAWAVGSGMLLDVALYHRIGPFREDFFIDHVDTEYCVRARAAGVRVVVCCGETVVHSIGRQQRRRLGAWLMRPTHHAADRRYYTARNGLRLALDSGRAMPAFRWHHLRYLVHDATKIVLYEDGRAAKLAALARGTLHALAGKSGPLLRQRTSPPVATAPDPR